MPDTLDGQLTTDATIPTTTGTVGQSAAVSSTLPAYLVGGDGKLAENWRQTLPEDIREEKCLGIFHDLPTLARSLVHAQRMVGKEKIARPGEHSTEAEWDEFYKAGGRPDTPEDYNFKRPDTMPEEIFNPGLAKQAQTLFHKLGLSGKQAKAIFDFHNQQAIGAAVELNKQSSLAKDEAAAALQKEWGGAYAQKMHIGNVALNQGANGDEDFRAVVSSKFGNDPDFIRLMANLGSKFAEHGAVMPGIQTPSESMDEINALMQTDAYRDSTNPGHKAAVAKSLRMFEKRRALMG